MMHVRGGSIQAVRILPLMLTTLYAKNAKIVSELIRGMVLDLD